MKAMIFVLTVLVAHFANATQVRQEAISAEQFKNETKKYLENRFSEGELQEIGGICTVAVLEQNGKTIIELTSEGFSFDVPLDADKSILVRREEDTDGSRTLIYKLGATRQLTLVHADDAYDSASLKMGGTQLTCLVED